MAVQSSMKPQDIVVAVRVATAKRANFTYAEASADLGLPASRIHASVQFLLSSRLVAGDTREGLYANKSALTEILISAVPYFFPPIVGGPSRGIPTGTTVLDDRNVFPRTAETSFVWPDSSGTTRGISLLPIHSCVLIAARNFADIHRLFAAVDVLRVEAAREREAAIAEIRSALD